MCECTPAVAPSINGDVPAVTYFEDPPPVQWGAYATSTYSDRDFAMAYFLADTDPLAVAGHMNGACDPAWDLVFVMQAGFDYVEVYDYHEDEYGVWALRDPARARIAALISDMYPALVDEVSQPYRERPAVEIVDTTPFDPAWF